jgi:2-polyprenyl-6-hydroxyphenyl methylase / 3-demethylubiquinone-9 3-methyltransferase
MPVDNEMYKLGGDLWWDEQQPLHFLRTALNPARLAYFNQVCTRLGLEPAGRTAVDIGCGGGLLAEELARMGMSVIGVDPAEASLRTAREHADRSGLQIDYRSGAGERLPLEDASVDIAVCVDVLEHVDDVDAVLRETARVLRPAGLYFFDTINRTPLSRLVMIKIGQEWRRTRWLPPDLHDWDHFITPDELRLAAGSAGLEMQEIIGMVSKSNPATMYRLIRQLKKGALTYGEFGRRLEFRLDDDVRIGYIGYATKPAS